MQRVRTFDVFVLTDGPWTDWNSWSACHEDPVTGERLVIRSRDCEYQCCNQVDDESHDFEEGNEMLITLVVDFIFLSAYELQKLIYSLLSPISMLSSNQFSRVSFPIRIC